MPGNPLGCGKDALQGVDATDCKGWCRVRAFRRTREDDGAAAVEFALLLPIFVMLCFGTISAGVSLFQYIGMTQGARDAARYGSTLPITTAVPPPAGEVSITTWLDQVRDVAVRESGWRDKDSVGGGGNGFGFVCVAYVRGAASGLATQRVTAGDVPSGMTLPSDNTCYDDGRADPRAQVYVRRNGELNVIFFGWDLFMTTRSSIPYEREVPS